MNKKYLLISILLLISSTLYQCKKKNNEEEVIPTPTSNITPCKIAALSADGKEVATFETFKDDQGKIIGRQINYIPFQPGSRKSTIEYNAKGQKIKEQFYTLSSDQTNFYVTYEYNDQDKLITRKSFTNSSSQPTVEKLEYNDKGQLEKIGQTSINATVYAHLIYDIDGDLLRVDWCDSATGLCTPIESYEYDKTKSYVPIPEPFVLPFLTDFDYGIHFCTKKNMYLTNGEIGSYINFKIETISDDGYPTSVAIYPFGANNIKNMYTYNYNCN